MDKALTAQLLKGNYISLETFRKNGEGVKTPVWFLYKDEVIYVRTGANLGKIKRIRNNPHVRVAISDMRGTPKGAWLDGQAVIISASEGEQVEQGLNKKYGLIKWLFDHLGQPRKGETINIAIRLN